MDNLWNCRGVARVSSTHILAEVMRDELGSELRNSARSAPSLPRRIPDGRVWENHNIIMMAHISDSRILTSFPSHRARIDH
jgi:hypothetical protein